MVLFTSFEGHADLTDVLNQVGQFFSPLLQANGIEWYALNDERRRRSLVMQILQQIPVLWIWDNVEPVAGFPAGTESQWTPAEQAELAAFLKQISLDRATQAKLLLTSRRDEQGWLGGVPHRVAMPRMRIADAANLARSLGTEKQIGRTEIADWQPLLDYCAGNPLTLRIIAGQAIRMGLRGEEQIENFVEAIRSGEQAIVDVDAQQGRDKSLGASLDYGFRNAFREDEQAIVALLHLFQGTVNVQVFRQMANLGVHSLPEVQGKTDVDFAALLDRAREAGLLTHLRRDAPGITRFILPYPGTCASSSPGATTARGAARPPRPRCAPGSRLSANWATTTAVNSRGQPGCHPTPGAGGGQPAGRAPRRQPQRLVGFRHRRHAGPASPLRVPGPDRRMGRLVAEIAPDYCTADDCARPRPGRRLYPGHGLPRRPGPGPRTRPPRGGRAAGEGRRLEPPAGGGRLALPAAAPLDAEQRNRIRTLGISVFALGQILREQGSPDCVAAYRGSHPARSAYR